MREWANRSLAITIFALVVLTITSGGDRTPATASTFKSTVVAEIICNSSTPVASPSPAPVASPSPSAVEFDQIYLDLMIEQNYRLLNLALVAADRFESPEVQQLAEQIVDGIDPVLQRLQDTREAWFDDKPVLLEAELVAALDEIGRSQPAVSGVPGAFEIVQSRGIVEDVCTVYEGFDVQFLTELIDQLDHAILFSEAANQFAGRDETKVIAALVVKTDQPFKEDAIAFRDLLLQGSPIPDVH